MRKRTLGVSFFLSLVIIYGLTYLATTYPLVEIEPAIAGLAKGRGRDIELEEKHEIGDSDIISLRPRRDDDGKS